MGAMDRELVRRAQDGDLGAFEALASLSHARLYRVAFGILRDTDRAKDATQQALVEIWKHIRGLREAEAYDAWSYRIVVRECVRDARRSDDRPLDASLEGHPLPQATDPFVSVVDRDRLERGFRQISVEHRAVLVMRYLLDLSYEDMAESLDVSPGTVASRLSRALAAMRAALEADERAFTSLRQAREVD